MNPLPWPEAPWDENPRYAAALRILASSLARLGQGDQAAEIARHVLRIEPKFTLNRLRVRLTFRDEGVWSDMQMACALRGCPKSCYAGVRHGPSDT